MYSSAHSAAEFLLLTVGAKQASLPFGRLQAKAAMPQAYAESEERSQERMHAIPREMAERRRLEKEAPRGAFCPLGPAALVACISCIPQPAGPYLSACEPAGGGIVEDSPNSEKGMLATLAEIKTLFARLDDLLQDYLSLCDRVLLREDDLGDAVRRPPLMAEGLPGEIAKGERRQALSILPQSCVRLTSRPRCYASGKLRAEAGV
jgi:hypothetical protein